MIDPRAELRAIQGAGARYDSERAPAGDLLLARRGTAFLARKINELYDSGLDDGSRRRIIARICYEARAQAEAIADLRAGSPAKTVTPAAKEQEIARSVTLPARALRHLFSHTCVHLNIEWRDLTDAEWLLNLADGTPVRSLPIARAAAVWQASIGLRNGARASDIPENLRNAFLLT